MSDLRQSGSAALGREQTDVDEALADLAANQIVTRIWAHDHTVWKPEPTEITNRLGWLDIVEAMRGELPTLTALVDQVRAAGYTHALLLGMGGSSLAPEVFARAFGAQPGYLELAVLDSTDPEAVLAHTRRLDPATTLFIVSTKSGGTVETASFFKFFYTWVAEKLGRDQAGAHFVAITDPGSGLADWAAEYGFRATLLNDPNIGGRYSVLSYFGLTAAALLGIDVARLLDRAAAAAADCRPENGGGIGAWLGAIVGRLALLGRDKLTFVTSPGLAPFGLWVEQLIAESTGKEGTGILPVDGETLLEPHQYGPDRLFAYLRLAGDDTYDAGVQALADAGYSTVRLELADLYDMSVQFFVWEFATAIAGYFLGINPFDQPNVESAKVAARTMMTAYREQGALPSLHPQIMEHGIRVYTDGIFVPDDLGGAVRGFLTHASLGDPVGGVGRSYVALQAYVTPTPAADLVLQELRTAIQRTTLLATTLGYGPRFLHSTGQLHKGDDGQGLFIQFTHRHSQDAPIPDEPAQPASSISFGVLIDAQVLGDRQALLDNDRRVITFDLGDDVVGNVQRLTALLLE